MENFGQLSSGQLDTTLTSGASNEMTAGAIGGLGDTVSISSGSSNLEQTQSLVKQKEAELKEMQNQIESCNQLVSQLTSQREMAIKRLSDMTNQIQELNKALEVERLSVEAKDQELKSKRTKLQSLKSEEDELMSKFGATKQELDVAAESLASTQSCEAQVQARIAEVKQFLAKTNSALDDIEKAITYKDTIKLSALTNQPLKPPSPLSTNSLLTNGLRGGQDSGNAMASFHDDPFKDDDPFRDDENLFGFDGEHVPNLQIPEDDPFA